MIHKMYEFRKKKEKIITKINFVFIIIILCILCNQIVVSLIFVPGAWYKFLTAWLAYLYII